MTDPRWQTVRERMHYAEMCGFGGFSDALAALDSLEAEAKTLRKERDYWAGEGVALQQRAEKAEAEVEKWIDLEHKMMERATEAEEENERLREATGGLLWLHNNRHNYGSDAWLEFFDAAVADARAALGGEE